MSEGLLGKEDMPIGTLVGPGTAREVNTGTWRTYFPVTDFENCTHCLQCWIFCPDGAVLVREGEKKGVNMKYCKGCGICAAECPVNCIEMKMESGRES